LPKSGSGFFQCFALFRFALFRFALVSHPVQMKEEELWHFLGVSQLLPGNHYCDLKIVFLTTTRYMFDLTLGELDFGKT
jgi:hypothetical protein